MIAVERRIIRPSSTTLEVTKHIQTDNPNHNITLENTKILLVGHKWFERGVKKAIHIRVLNPSLNRDGDVTTCPQFGIPSQRRD